MCMNAADCRHDEPEQRLSRLFKSELNIDISPDALRIFVRSQWKLVAAYAHAIHGSTPAEATAAKPVPETVLVRVPVDLVEAALQNHRINKAALYPWPDKGRL